MTLRRNPLRHDGGSMALETVILAPAMVAFVALIIFGARVSLAQQAVQVAANDAARSASIERTKGAALTSSQRSASASLTSQDAECTSVQVTVDASGFDSMLGEQSHVEARVSCTLSIGSLSMLGIPGRLEISRDARSPIDSYRERSGP